MDNNFYILFEKEGREENWYVSDYAILHKKPNSVPEGWDLAEVEVVESQEMNSFIIVDNKIENIDDIYFIFNTKASKASVKKVVDTIKAMDGYNTEILHDVLTTIFKGDIKCLDGDLIEF